MAVKEKELSRRRFIKSAGATLAVTALSAGVGGLLTGCSKPEEETTGGANGQPVEVTWPLGYKPLDPDKAEEMAYNSYKAGNGCAQGVADALLGLAAEEYGAPYSYIPPQMFNVGKGGIVGWGASCGALLGAVFFIGLVAPQEDQAAIVNELMAWYQQASFPYYKPSDMEFKQTVADSTLCHVSVTRFLQENNLEANAPEKAERCGGVSGDVARKTVELLNAYVDNQFTAVHKPQGTETCTTCHSNDHQGKDNCVTCHGEVDEIHDF